MNEQSIQLITTNKKNLELTYEGSKFLNQINEPFAICVCVGPYRQGKSYLLSRLADAKNAFNVGNTDLACTKGAWICKKPFVIKKKDNSTLNMYFVDTEGLESDNNKWDTKLFLISFILSSVFLYNTKNALTADAIKKMSTLSALKKYILKDKCHENDLPVFIWVVRDYALLSTETPKERLNNFLKPEVNDDDDDDDDEDDDDKLRRQLEIKQNNQTKKCMKEAFKAMDCVYLPVPIADGVKGMNFEKALQSLNVLETNDLRYQFNDSIKDLKEKISENARTKSVNNREFTGPIFAEFLINTIKLINSESNIVLKDVMSSSMKAAAEVALTEASNLYYSEMKKFVWNDKKPVKWQTFVQNEQAVRNKCIDIFKNKIKYASEELYNEYLKKFNDIIEIKEKNELIGGKLFEFKQINKANIENFNKKTAAELWNKEMKNKADKSNIQFKSKIDFRIELDRFKKNLKQELFEVIDFDSFWGIFSSKSINLDQIQNDIDTHFNKIEKEKQEAQLKAEREARLKAEKEFQEEKRKAEEEARRKKELEKQVQDEKRKAEEETRRKKELEKELELERSRSYSRSNDSGFYGNLGCSTPNESFSYMNGPMFLPSPSYSCSSGYNSRASPCETSFNSKHSPSNSSLNGSSFITKSGTPDMRYSENRAHLLNSQGRHITKSGRLDMRYKENW